MMNLKQKTGDATSETGALHSCGYVPLNTVGFFFDTRKRSGFRNLCRRWKSCANLTEALQNRDSVRSALRDTRPAKHNGERTTTSREAVVFGRSFDPALA